MLLLHFLYIGQLMGMQSITSFSLIKLLVTIPHHLLLPIALAQLPGQVGSHGGGQVALHEEVWLLLLQVGGFRFDAGLVCFC